MYARSTTINGKSENIDAGLRFIENEVRPVIDRLSGCLGLSCLIDRKSGQAIVTSSWETEDAMRESDAQLRPIRDRGREIFGGDMQIDEWEIAVMHRISHGSHCRVTWAQGADADRLLGVVRSTTMPALERLQGFCGASLLIDRDSGMACVTTTWDTRESLEASRQNADQIRAGAAQDSAMEVLEVREYELASAHLHVPELV